MLLSAAALAHKQLAAERAILQVRPDAIEILYEITFATGTETARWRLLYDQNRDGRLTKAEYQQLAQGVAAKLRESVKLTFDGHPLPLEIVDAKLSTSETARPLAGPLQAIVFLRATDLAPGLRKIGVEVAPIADGKAAATVRLESEGCHIQQITGAPILKMEGDQKAVQLREGWPATLLVDFPLPDAGTPAKP